MSFIAISGFPMSWTLAGIVKTFAPILKCNFTALNFLNNRKPPKTVIIQLTKHVPVSNLIKTINAKPIRKLYLKAYIPKDVPEYIRRSKGVPIPYLLRKKFQVREELPPELTLQFAHEELLTELQSKYTGLYSLSKKNGHKLMEAISETIFSRLAGIMDLNPDTLDNAFVLTRTYRKTYPHLEDFEWISSTNKKLGGEPIDEATFTSVSTHPYAIDNIPYDKIKSICAKYSDKICEEVTSHLANLPVDPDLNSDTEDDIARKKVRAELKKLIPFLPAMIKQVVAQNFIPEKAPLQKVRIYGEPFLPREGIAQFLKRYHTLNVRRSERLYNCIRFKIPVEEYGSLMAMDGTVIGGSKLVVRPAEIPLYQTPQELIAKMKAHFEVDIDADLIDDALDEAVLGQDIGDELLDVDIADEIDEDIGDVDIHDAMMMDDEELVDENWAEEL